MKFIRKIKKFTLACTVISGILVGFWVFGQPTILVPEVYAANITSCPNSPSGQPQTVQTDGQTCCPGTSNQQNSTTCFFDKYINPLIQLLSAAVGLVAIIAVIIGSIEYITSAGDPQKLASGRTHITNALLGLFAFALLYAFLQFLVPGGLFNGS